MTFEEAIAIMLRGGKVQREGKTYALDRVLCDVTDPDHPVHVRAADFVGSTDWEKVSP